MKHLILNLTKLLLLAIILTALQACDKHELPQPQPTLLSSSEPGTLRFTFEQHSQGAGEEFETDSLFLLIKNQGQQSIHSVYYAIRGFSEMPKKLENLSYWDQGIYRGFIKPHETVRLQIHSDFHSLIPNEKLEIDLISYKIQSQTIAHLKSGSYNGEFQVVVDSLYGESTPGNHMTWIDHAGNINIYFNSGKFNWTSYRGRLFESGKTIGTLITEKKSIEIEGRLIKPSPEIEYKLNFNFNQETDTIHSYYFSLTLNKN